MSKTKELAPREVTVAEIDTKLGSTLVLYHYGAGIMQDEQWRIYLRAPRFNMQVLRRPARDVTEAQMVAALHAQRDLINAIGITNHVGSTQRV